jgi:hypothetical protein
VQASIDAFGEKREKDSSVRKRTPTVKELTLGVL